jgi:RHH-type proline utilization regulon transcriptional repressor/proline dehydrogenase/delta 1-pyrroline-5-carboxylate dehydrogenase
MLSRRVELASLIVYEAGKVMKEAMADVDEAIDFLNFYAREEGRLHLESRELLSRGIVGVISPWNFPIAISTGMVAGALVAGNHVILKSALTTALVAQEMVNIFLAAGIPGGTLIHLPGRGSQVGQPLVEHQKVAMIVFTGSKEVGSMIGNRVGKRVYHNPLYDMEYPAKAITEMGGKNAVIVTENAELDEAMAGIIYSAFGHAGQKCSAASRVIVSNKMKDKLLERLGEAARDIQVGPAFELKTAINPLISEKERNRLWQQADEMEKEAREHGGKVITNRVKEDLPGYCVGPMVVDMPKDRSYHEDSFCQLELFAPVVHVIGYDSLDEALDIYNSVEYGLTGGVFSQSQDDIDYITARVQNGNVYVNRGITGARVGIEPFGGFKMSGTGPKAGSRLYVPAFHVVRDQQLAREGTGNGTTPVLEAMPFGGLARPNNQRLEKRLKSLENAWNILSGQLTNKMQRFSDPEIYEKRAREFVTCAHAMLPEFLYQPHPNRDIPGQESYDDYSMIKENTVMVSQQAAPDLPVMLHVLSALVTGSGLTILAMTEESYAFWSPLQSIGLPGNNLKLYKANEETVQDALGGPFIQNIILDVAKKNLPGMLEWIYPEKYHEKRTRHLLTSFDAPGANFPGDYIVQFINVRSMAINTMRYGAPLELDLDGPA